MPECILENNGLSSYLFALFIHLREENSKVCGIGNVVKAGSWRNFKHAGACLESSLSAWEAYGNITDGESDHLNAQSRHAESIYHKNEFSPDP